MHVRCTLVYIVSTVTYATHYNFAIWNWICTFSSYISGQQAVQIQEVVLEWKASPTPNRIYIHTLPKDSGLQLQVTIVGSTHEHNRISLGNYRYWAVLAKAMQLSTHSSDAKDNLLHTHHNQQQNKKQNSTQSGSTNTNHKFVNRRNNFSEVIRIFMQHLAYISHPTQRKQALQPNISMATKMSIYTHPTYPHLAQINLNLSYPCAGPNDD